MHTHRNTFRKQNSLQVAKPKMEFDTKKRKNIGEVSKLVYDDHITICKVVGSTTLQKFLPDFGF